MQNEIFGNDSIRYLTKYSANELGLHMGWAFAERSFIWCTCAHVSTSVVTLNVKSVCEPIQRALAFASQAWLTLRHTTDCIHRWADDSWFRGEMYWTTISLFQIVNTFWKCSTPFSNCNFFVLHFILESVKNNPVHIEFQRIEVSIW